MTEIALSANISETSAASKDVRKRSTQARLSRRIAKQETAAATPEPKVPVKQEKKPEKRHTRPKPDPNRETVITETGLALHPNDYIYLLSEPPGEPYYIARIMEFIYVDPEESSAMESADFPISSSTGRKVKALRVNWFYRPQDISHKTHTDTRCLYATMHSDVNPISVVRGLCTIRHRSEIPNQEFEDYKKGENNFWFSRLHDRYIQRNYDVIPTTEVTNVPDRVGEVLREKWKYVVVENGAKKELCIEPRRCTKCGEWCRSSESVRCAECHTDWHMKCVKPPLPRKPTKGYHWACGPCIRARMKEMKANNIPMFQLKKRDVRKEEEEDEDEEELVTDDESDELSESGIPESAGPITRADTPITVDLNDERETKTNEGKFAARLWPYRYLGIHCKVEDVLDSQDRIYPRAASRIGPRHQANVLEWPGRPIEYLDRRPAHTLDRADKKFRRGRTVIATKEGTETPDDSSIHTAGLDEDRSPWIQERPIGYVARGEDNYSMDSSGTQLIWKKPSHVTDAEVDAYLTDLHGEAERLGVHPSSTSFLDGAINALQYTSFNFKNAKELVSTLTPESLWNPIFTPEEVKRFEAGVAKFGSELHLVAKEVGTRATAECVRFYYVWKKTNSGKEIWGKQEGRKGNRQKALATEDVPQVGDSSDDSAFDDHKAMKQRKKFECKFCHTQTSRRWRKAPGGILIGGEDGNSILALCDRCGDLWRRYGLQYVVPEDLRKPVEGKVPRKRRTDEDEEETTGRRKRVRKEDKMNGKIVRRTRAGSIEEPSYPPCAVCGFVEDEEPVICHVCGLCVHAGCYGSPKKNRKGNWLCDICINEKQPLVSTKYDCVLCSMQEPTEIGPNGELAPRLPLKATANNNWAHVTCAVFSPETRFGSAKHLKPIEGIGSIPPSRWIQRCSICNEKSGAIINCHDCKTPVHVSCALSAGYTAGFDIQPVKGSRRDVVQVVTFGGETGVMTAAVWCPEHDLRKTIVHPLTEVDPFTKETALMTFVTMYKLADLTLTGTMRKAQLAATATKTSRRNYPAHGVSPTPGLIHDPLKRGPSSISTITQLVPTAEEKQKSCGKCDVKYSPVWWPRSQMLQDASVLCHQCNWESGSRHDDHKPEEHRIKTEELGGINSMQGSPVALSL